MCVVASARVASRRRGRLLLGRERGRIARLQRLAHGAVRTSIAVAEEAALARVRELVALVAHARADRTHALREHEVARVAAVPMLLHEGVLGLRVGTQLAAQLTLAERLLERYRLRAATRLAAAGRARRCSGSLARTHRASLALELHRIGVALGSSSSSGGGAGSVERRGSTLAHEPIEETRQVLDRRDVMLVRQRACEKVLTRQQRADLVHQLRHLAGLHSECAHQREELGHHGRPLGERRRHQCNQLVAEAARQLVMCRSDLSHSDGRELAYVARRLGGATECRRLFGRLDTEQTAR